MFNGTPRAKAAKKLPSEAFDPLDMIHVPVEEDRSGMRKGMPRNIVSPGFVSSWPYPHLHLRSSPTLYLFERGYFVERQNSWSLVRACDCVVLYSCRWYFSESRVEMKKIEIPRICSCLGNDDRLVVFGAMKVNLPFIWISQVGSDRSMSKNPS